MLQTNDTVAQALIALVEQEFEELPRKAERLRRNAEAILKLQSHGLTNVTVSPGLQGGAVINVDRENLPKVRKALGRLRKSYTSVINVAERSVRIYLEAEAYPGIQIAFRTVLPENSRCRIETREFTDASLVCDR